LKLHGQDFEIGDFQAQRSLLAPASVRVILDVGANIGNTIAAYRDAFPEADVYAFEPFPPIYEKLAARFAGDGRVHPFHLAAGRRPEIKPFFVNEYVDTNSLLPRPSSSRRYYAADNLPLGTVPVEVTTLDEFAQQQELVHIDILKLDIQGGEADALAGARRLLSGSAVDLIFSEVFFAPHYEGASLFHEITGILAGYSYTLYNLYHLVSGSNGQLRFADALYVSDRIRRNAVDGRPPEA
jgi:FkbM family methyltransferase